MRPTSKQMLFGICMVVTVSAVIFLWGLQFKFTLATLQQEIKKPMDNELKQQLEQIKKDTTEAYEKAKNVRIIFEEQQQHTTSSTSKDAETTSSTISNDIILKMKEKIDIER